jgi:hypothetical protein
MTGVFENTCDMDGVTCQVPTLWDYTESTTAVSTGNIFNYHAQIFGNMQDLVDNTLIAIGYNDTMNFDLDKYGRQTTVKQATFMAAIESTTRYSSKFDGHLGLAPYSERPEFKQYNFMWQLKDKGLIDHMVVSVFAEVADVNNQNAESSSIKFGSWDQEACLDDGASDITMFQTIDEKAWMLNGTEFMIGDVPFIQDGKTRKLDINTHLPFVFMPDDDWVHFAELM